MSIDSIGVDLDTVLSLTEWLESDAAQTVQRQLEAKITEMLFGHDPSSPAFKAMAVQLAWIGSRVGERALLERDIFAITLPRGYSIDPCGLWKDIGKAGKAVGRAGKAVGEFVADHVVEIAVGAAICATGVGIALATGYTISAVVGGVVVAGAGSIFQSEEQPNPHIPAIPLPDPQACSQAELVAIQQGLTATLPKVELPSSTNEILVTADGIWANGQFFYTASIMNNSVFSPIFQENTLGLMQGSDWKTFHAYQFLQLNANGVIPHQLRGESALILGNYAQAISDLEKAIEANPADSLSYLERGAAHFSLGEYDRSLEDYQQFVSQTEPLSVSEFCVGFAKGLPKGAYESGEGMLLFLVDFVQHPIHTSKQAIDAITTLVDLVGRDEWGALTEALSPEIYQLVTQWNTLPSDQRGELAGFAVGKLGADILTPAGLAKVASKSLKSAQELVAVCKNLQIVQETLILETAAGIGNSAKIAEVIEVGQKTVHLADELGFTAREMGQLKQAGKLEGTVLNTFEHLSLSMQESIKLFEEAGNKLKSYQGIYMSESQARELIHATGLPTFLRPKGIPENYRIKLSDKPGGIKYVHPTDEGTYIRIMPGKAHSKNPRQQRPYVNHRINGKSLDKHGNIVSNKSEEAHIFLDEFVYKDVGTN